MGAITLQKMFMGNESYIKVGLGEQKVPLNFIIERFCLKVPSFTSKYITIGNGLRKVIFYFSIHIYI